MTYEYVCTACGHGWEAEQSISAAPLTDCPSCQAKSAKRQVSGGAGFILKGGGWYSDLYGSAPARKSEDAGGGSSDTSAKKETGSADTTASKPKADGGSGSGSGTSSTGGTSGTGSSSSGGGKSSGASAA